MKYVVYPYKIGSQSARNLAQALDVVQVKEAGNFVHKLNTIVINYGNPRQGKLNLERHVLNKPNAVAMAINKLATFEKLKAANVPVPAYTTSKATACQWVNAGEVIFCRTTLAGHGGAGIVIIKQGDGGNLTEAQIDNAPLYTKLFSKKDEYRVHVFDGAVVDFVKKKKTNNFEGERNPYVRNMDNGWIFAREDVTLPKAVADAAVAAVKALGLDFGAVDLADNKRGDVAVFEINTAPGIEGTTVNKWAEAFKNYLQKQKPTNAQTFTRIAYRTR